MKSFLETVIGGAIGMIALYVVGKVAYQAGKEVAKAKCEYEALRKEIDNDGGKDGSDTTVFPEMKQNSEEVNVVWERTNADRKQSTVQVPMKRTGKLSMVLNAVKLFRRKDSVIGDLVKHPEAHKIEAFVEGDDLRINVSKRPAFA